MVRPCGARGFHRSGKCGLASMYVGREIRSKAPNRRSPSMRALQISAYGDPLKVLELVDIPEPGVPGAGEVLIDVELASMTSCSYAASSGARRRQLSLETRGSVGLQR